MKLVIIAIAVFAASASARYVQESDVLSVRRFEDSPNAKITQIGVRDFGVGMAVEARFLSPSTQQVVLNLVGVDDNIPLHINPRYDTEYWNKVFVLNSKIDGTWGTEEVPLGYDFSAGVVVTLRVETKEDHYAIFVNGVPFAQYEYKLPVDTVENIVFVDKSPDGELISLTVGVSSALGFCAE